MESNRTEYEVYWDPVWSQALTYEDRTRADNRRGNRYVLVARQGPVEICLAVPSTLLGPNTSNRKDDVQVEPVRELSNLARRVDKLTEETLLKHWGLV